MYTNKVTLPDYQISFPLDKYAPLDKILYLDIETTGLSPASSRLYMIGLAYYADGMWCIEQWLAENAAEEPTLLLKLADLLSGFTHIIHFNGNRFDIPYLTERAHTHHIAFTLDTLQGIDIYKRISPLKNLLVLPNCKQKTIEQFLGIDRIDQYTGGELIQVYKTYVQNPSPALLELLLQHNLDDMKGMLDITPILSYCELAEEEITVTSVEMQKCTSTEHSTHYELLMTLRLSTPLPKKLFARYEANFLTVTGSKAVIKVPVYDKELKFFYANYKDYYYVPSTDAAFHKSVAAHVDSSLRKQAAAATCYTRKDSLFLKQYATIIEPFFKADYKDKETYFEITEETKTNRKLFTSYAQHILSVIIQGRG